MLKMGWVIKKWNFSFWTVINWSKCILVVSLYIWLSIYTNNEILCIIWKIDLSSRGVLGRIYASSIEVLALVKSTYTNWVQGHDWHSRTVHLCILAADFYNLRRKDAQYSSHDIPWDWNNRSLTSKHNMFTHMLRGGNSKLLLGKLTFVAHCVKPATIFICRLFNWLRKIQSSEGPQLISLETITDFLWWQNFLPLYKSIYMMDFQDWLDADQFLSCDSCLQGASTWFDGKYFHCKFPNFI